MGIKGAEEQGLRQVLLPFFVLSRAETEHQNLVVADS